MFTPLQPPGIITPEAALRWVEENFRDLERALKSVGKREPFLPVWSSSGTQPVLGNGVLEGSIVTFGASLLVSVHLAMGSTTTYGTGFWRFSVPRVMVNAEPSAPGPLGMYDISAGIVYSGVVLLSPAVSTGAPGSVAPYPHATTGLNPTQPFTWAAGDQLWFSVLYPTE